MIFSPTPLSSSFVVLLGRKQKKFEMKHAVIIITHQGEHKHVAFQTEAFWDPEEKVLLSLNCHRSRDSADAVPGAGCACSHTQARSLEMSAQQ